MLKKIVLVLVVLVVAVLAFATTKPDTFSVQRTATINAVPEVIYPHLIDFHKWGAWSPWEKLDPNMTKTYGGAESGVGATYAWEGNSDVGAGSMEITGAVPYSQVDIKLDFLKPFEGHNTTVFSLTPDGASTRVTWLMEGPSPYMTKVMTVFMSMDKLIGKDFEAGLANLKAVTEQ
jgi:hypothetical protein